MQKSVEEGRMIQLEVVKKFVKNNLRRKEGKRKHG